MSLSGSLGLDSSSPSPAAGSSGPASRPPGEGPLSPASGPVEDEMTYEFTFESTDVYRLAVRVARWMRQAPWRPDQRTLRDQGVRAAESTVLNIAEGWSRSGQAGRNHLRIAAGSAGECVAVLDLVDFKEAADRQQDLRRIGAMLNRLQRR